MGRMEKDQKSFCVLRKALSTGICRVAKQCFSLENIEIPSRRALRISSACSLLQKGRGDHICSVLFWWWHREWLRRAKLDSQDHFPGCHSVCVGYSLGKKIKAVAWMCQRTWRKRTHEGKGSKPASTILFLFFSLELYLRYSHNLKSK